MSRVKNWPKKLSDYIDAHKVTPFEFGIFDCGHFANGAIKVVTGKDPLSADSYIDEAQKDATVESYGGIENMSDVLMCAAGFRETSPKLAGRGDVVMLRNGDGNPIVGVIGIDSTPLVPNVRGLTRLRRTDILRAWRVE